MIWRWEKIITNPLVILILNVLLFVSLLMDTSIINVYFPNSSSILPFVVSIFYVITLLLSFIFSIIKSNNFLIRPTVISLFIIIFTSILSFFSVLLGYLALAVLFCIWIFCFILSIINTIISVKNSKNHILNYILLFSLLVTLIGGIYTHINVKWNENKILKIANEIDSYYENTDNKYNYDEINTLLGEYKKMKLYDIKIEDDSYTINKSFRFAGGIYRMTYRSTDRKIINLTHH